MQLRALVGGCAVVRVPDWRRAGAAPDIDIGCNPLGTIFKKSGVLSDFGKSRVYGRCYCGERFWGGGFLERSRVDGVMLLW